MTINMRHSVKLYLRVSVEILRDARSVCLFYKHVNF